MTGESRTHLDDSRAAAERAAGLLPEDPADWSEEHEETEDDTEEEEEEENPSAEDTVLISHNVFLK